MELPPVCCPADRPENGNRAFAPVAVFIAFRRPFKADGRRNRTGQVGIRPRVNVIGRELGKEGRLRNPSLAHRRHTVQAADAFNLHLSEFQFIL